MRMPGVEPGSQAWEACMMPLHYMRRQLHLIVAVAVTISMHTDVDTLFSDGSWGLGPMGLV